MMTAALIVAALVVAAIVAFWLVNRSAAGKIGFLGRAQMGKLGRAAEGADPVGQMRQAAEDAGNQIARAREALVRADGARAALERQVKADAGEVNALVARITRKLDGGAPPTDPDVVRWSEELARAKRYKAQNEAQLAENTKLCTEALVVIKRENDKVTDLQHRADRVDVQLDISNAQAAVAAVADHLRPGGVSGIAHSAARFEEIAQRKIDENSARMRLLASMGGGAEEAADASSDGAAALEEILKARQPTA